MCLAQAVSVLNGTFATKKEYAVISFSGGESTLSADIAEEMGVELAEISEETKQEMKKYIPDFAQAKNPLDATTSLFRDDEKTIGLLKALNDDPAVGAITVGTNIKKDFDDTTASLCGAIAKAKARGVEKPVLAIPSLEGYRYRESRKILEDAGVPLMSSMGTSFQALRKLAKFAEYDYRERTLASAVPGAHGEKDRRPVRVRFQSGNESQRRSSSRTGNCQDRGGTDRSRESDEIPISHEDQFFGNPS